MIIPTTPVAICPQKAEIIATVEDFNKLHCVYEHWGFLDENSPEQCLYVGVCELRELMIFPDARYNSEWDRIFKNGTTLIIKLIASHPSIHVCNNLRVQLMRDKRAHCNLHGISANNTAVRCNETGEIFASGSAAAKALGLSQSALSSHLNDIKGYKRVKGKTFSRAPMPIVAPQWRLPDNRD